MNPLLKEASASLREEAAAKARDLYNFCFDRNQYKEDQARKAAETRIRETERLRAANDNQLLEEETYQQAAGAEGYFPGTGGLRIEGIAAGDSYADEDGEERKDGEREEHAQARNARGKPKGSTRAGVQEPFRFDPNVAVMEGAAPSAANVNPASGDAPSILSRIGDVAQELFGISSAEAAGASAVASGGRGLGFEIPAAYLLKQALGVPVTALPAAIPVLGVGIAAYEGNLKAQAIASYSVAAGALSKEEYQRVAASLKPEDITRAINILPDFLDVSNLADYEYIKTIAVGGVVASKGGAITMSLPESPARSILITPDEKEKHRQLGRLPGFEPPEFQAPLPGLEVAPDLPTLPGYQPHGPIEQLPGFEQSESHWRDLVLARDYELDKREVKPASVKDAPEVYQCGFGKIYKDPEQKVGNKAIWWSKDTAKHSGASQGLPPSAYKLFVKTKTMFQWIADADRNGNVIEGKNKSEVGRIIPITDCHKVK